MDLDADRRVERLGLDHETLLRLLDEIVGAAAQRASGAGLEEAILVFAEQLSDHVAAEQELMHDLGYPATEPHAAAHDRLLQELSDLLPSRSRNFSEDALEGARAFELAMQQHIITWDWNLLDYVAKVGRQADRSS